MSNNGNCCYRDALIVKGTPRQIADTADTHMLLWLRTVDSILLRQAGLGIRKVQTQGENLKALRAEFDDRGKVAGSWLLKISTRRNPLYIWCYRAVEG